MMKKALQYILARSTRAILKKHQPEIVAITGSVGKTSTKTAIACVLRHGFTVRESFKNYNNEIGLPLTVIGREAAGRSIKGWFDVLRHARLIARSPRKSYPEILVLEMGIDRPGDMDYLVKIAPPSRAVMTRLGTAHAEFFASTADLHREKLKLAHSVAPGGWCVYNFEDEKLREAMKDIKVSVLSYGFSEGADVRAEQISFNLAADTARRGVTCKLRYEGTVVPIFIPGIFSRTALLSALAGAAVGFTYNLNSLDIAKALERFASPPGRMSFLEGKNKTTIIDDTYNASPESTEEALAMLKEVSAGSDSRSWAVLGDMRELGKESAAGHTRIGELCSQQKIDRLITVGKEAELIRAGAIGAGMKENDCRHFNTSSEAGEYLEKELEADDVCLIKGSQAVRMEKIVKRLMNDPHEAERLLVRQGSEWD